MSNNTKLDHFIIVHQHNLRRLINEIATVTHIGINDVDDGPGVFHDTVDDYKGYSSDMINKLGWEIIDYLIPNGIELNKYDTKYPNGPIDKSTSFPTLDYVTGTDISKIDGYDTWKFHINRMVSKLGMYFVDNSLNENTIISKLNEEFNPNKILLTVDSNGYYKATLSEKYKSTLTDVSNLLSNNNDKFNLNVFKLLATLNLLSERAYYFDNSKKFITITESNVDASNIPLLSNILSEDSVIEIKFPTANDLDNELPANVQIEITDEEFLNMIQQWLFMNGFKDQSKLPKIWITTQYKAIIVVDSNNKELYVAAPDWLEEEILNLI